MNNPIRTLLMPVLSGLALLVAQSVNANNIQVANFSLTGNTGTSAQVQFDLSWENSWRGGGVTNWDAAWVFVKYRTSLTGPWLHANLNNTGHVAASGSQIDLGLLTPGTAYNASTNPVVGVFIYRNAPGNGTLNLPGTQLQWNFGALGLAYNDIAQIQVFAIEMVYVPQGAFAAGSGGGESGSIYTSPNTTSPYMINSEAAITVGTVAGNLRYGNSEGVAGDVAGPIPAAFPKGFGAFYCMKYELSQQGYVDFLNTLTYTQQVTRTATAPTSAAGTGALIGPINMLRNGIDIQTPGVASTTPAVYACNLNGNTTYGEPGDGKDIACNYLSWGDLTAYLDWSGLRPMTELEFEKACRGTIAPVPSEYPWGTTGLGPPSGSDTNGGFPNEGVAGNYSITQGNASYGGAYLGPRRVGIFAANGSNNGRVTAGASYYGIMELGGNVQERSVTIGNANGRGFTGAHGNGVLAASGNPDGATWPAPTTADGAGFRGGAFGSVSLQVSYRFTAASTNSDRLAEYGARGVRRVP